MSGKNLLEGRSGPVTQSIEAVKTLLVFVGRASNPLPSEVSLDNGRLVLVLSKKRDVYYTVTATACSCPSFTYRGGQCKHMRKFFPITKPADDLLAGMEGFEDWGTDDFLEAPWSGKVGGEVI